LRQTDSKRDGYLQQSVHCIEVIILNGPVQSSLQRYIMFTSLCTITQKELNCLQLALPACTVQWHQILLVFDVYIGTLILHTHNNNNYYYYNIPGAVLGKNIGGGDWPLIICEATTSRTTVSNCPVLSNLCTVITVKLLGAWARFRGPVPAWPQHRTATATYNYK